MPYVVFILTVVLPIALWLWFIRWEDKSEPEPGRLMRRCFYVGLSAVIVAGTVEYFLFESLGLPHILAIDASNASFLLFTIAMFLVGPIEELTKYLVLRSNVYLSHDFNQVFDGIVYGITIALGFSFVENIFYFFELYSKSTDVFLISTTFRGIFTTLVHVTCTGIMGYFVGKAKFSTGNRVLIIAQGVTYAALLHSTFNWLVASHIPYGAVLAVLLVGSCFIALVRVWNRSDVRMVWRYVPAASPTPALPKDTV